MVRGDPSAGLDCGALCKGGVLYQEIISPKDNKQNELRALSSYNQETVIGLILVFQILGPVLLCVQ